MEGYIIEYNDKLKESVLNQKEYDRLLDENDYLKLKIQGLIDENENLKLNYDGLIKKNQILLDELNNIKNEFNKYKSEFLSIQEQILNNILDLKDNSEKNNALINSNFNKLNDLDISLLNGAGNSMESSFSSRFDSLEIRQLDIHNLLLHLKENYFNEFNFEKSHEQFNNSSSDIKNDYLVLNLRNKLINMQDNLVNINDIQYKSLELIYLELKYGLLFNDTIENSKWLINKNFSLINSDSNYSFMYVLYKILDKVKPKNILEFSLGQTTKMITQYVDSNKESKLTVIDSNQEWIDIFSNNLILSENVHLAFCDLELFKFESTENYHYKNISNIVEDNKFDLIIINGPQGFLSGAYDVLIEYPRSDIWDLIDDNLNEEFIIIMDNYNRSGEKNTIRELKKLLNKKNIIFDTYHVTGLTEQFIICSNQNKFINNLCWEF